jgi:hypothetical protein
MKKAGRTICVILFLILFSVALATGLYWAAYSLGQDAPADLPRLQDRLANLADRLGLSSILPGERESFSIHETRDLDLSGIQTIDISGISESISVRPTNRNASVTLTGHYAGFAPIRWTVERQGDRLKIQTRYPRFGLIFNKLSFILVVPRSYDGSIVTDTVSGAIQFSVEQETDWSKIEASSISGDIDIARSAAPVLQFSSVSGNVSIRQITGSVQGKTISGSIVLIYKQFKSSSIKTISGVCTIKIPHTANLDIDFSSVSGSFANDGLDLVIDKQTGHTLEGSMNNGGQTLTVKTTSGDLFMESLRP